MKLNSNHVLRGVPILLLLLLFSGTAWAQLTITGNVTDGDSQDPLIGASIVVTGSTTGTVTDFDGNFELSVPAEAESITVSYTGYGTQEIPLVEGQVAYEIALTSGELLQEVVVVGYGAVRKQDLTGAVTVLSDEDFNKGVITSPEQLIQGRAAGVQVTQTSGEPGAGVNFRIRGTSSVRSNNNPLFVVDGVPLSGENTSASGNIGGLGNTSARNPLNFLNPSDIESINVLKDASATAIYGSRGANGVVIITTRSGAGAGILSYETNIGVAGISKRYDILNRQEYLDAYRSFNGDAATQALDGGADVNWQDELFRTAFTQSHNISFGGGADGGSYRFSASYLDQEGIVEDSGLKRLSARFNGAKKFINDRLGLATQVTVSDIHDDNVPITTNSGFEGDLLGNILKANPTQTIYNEDGTFNQVGQTEPNPLALLRLYEGYTNTLRLLANISADFALTDALNFKTVYGVDRSFSTRTDAQSRDQRIQGVENVGRLSISDLQTNTDLWENYFTLDTELGGAITFQGLLGYSYQRFERIGKGASYAYFRTSDLDVMINNLASSTQNGGAIGAVGNNSFRTQDELQSFYGRANFDIANKYLVTATLRADGSTRFGSGNRYGLFPSFAFKWRLLEEDFAPDAFSDLGLRVGYGVTGNQELPHNQYQRRQRYGDYGYNAGTTTIDGGGLSTVAFANPDLKWESTSQINAGIDWGFNNNRISGSIDYYYKSTNDLLIQVTSAQPAVQPFFFTNLDADVINEGVELAVNYIAVDRDNFSWDVIFNVGYNNNIVRNLGSRIINTGAISGQGLTGAYAQRIADNQPLYAWYLREFDGHDAEGNSIYRDGDFQQFTGDSPLPKVTGGLTNQLNIGNLDINLFFSGQFGFSIYNNTANAFYTAGALANGRNVSRDVVGNGEGNLNAPDVSTRFLERGDFVRLQNASIGYNFPTSGDVLSNLRISVTGQNLFVITGYSGQDPEVSISKPINNVPSVGIDYTAYPRARTVTLGLSASF